MMTQNIYDTAEFFERYSKYPRAIDGLSGASEWPRLREMLPATLSRKRVLDLGCGDGWFCRWAQTQGASRVDGVDASHNMLDRAAKLTARGSGVGHVVTYRQADLEEIDLSPSAYDVVFSGLAIHYVENLSSLLERVHQALLPGGHFVFSVEHPVFTAPPQPGFLEREDGSKHWVLDHYFNEGRREVNWLVQGVQKQHRTLGTLMTMLLGAGFELAALDEWGRTDDGGREHPAWPNEEGVCPRFLLIGARKPLSL